MFIIVVCIDNWPEIETDQSPHTTESMVSKKVGPKSPKHLLKLNLLTVKSIGI